MTGVAEAGGLLGGMLSMAGGEEQGASFASELETANARFLFRRWHRQWGKDRVRR